MKDSDNEDLENEKPLFTQSPIIGVKNSITLVKSAVISNRLAHLQPATACVISSIRSLLSAADALNKDSMANKISSSIADNRRNLLSLLSRLVVQSRLVMKEALQSTKGNFAIAEDLEEIIPMADQVLVLSQNFIKLCENHGINLEDDITPQSSPNQSNLSRFSPKSSTSVKDTWRNSNKSIPRQSSRLSRMTSYDSFKSSAAQSIASSAASLVLNNSHDISDISHDDFDYSSSDQTFSKLLYVINEAHKSAIAALLGHMHAMPAETSAISNIHLIDLLKETISIVKRLLTVLQSIQQNEPLNSIVPHDSALLDNVIRLTYNSTDNIVSAAEGLVFSSKSNGQSSEDQEDRKQHLLICVMGIHKAGDEAFQIANRMVEYAAKASISLVLSTSNSTTNLQDITNERSQKQSNRYQHRRQQTLSIFDKKAISLTCLKEKFQDNDEGKEALTTPTMKDKFDENRPDSRASQDTYTPNITFTSTDNLNTPTQSEHLRNLSPISATFTEKEGLRKVESESPNALSAPINSESNLSTTPESPVGIALPLQHKGHAVNGKAPSLSHAPGTFDLAALKPRMRARAATVGAADLNRNDDKDSPALKLSFGMQRDDTSTTSMTSYTVSTDENNKAGTSTPATVHSWVEDKQSFKENPKFEIGADTESESEDSVPPLPSKTIKGRQRAFTSPTTPSPSSTFSFADAQENYLRKDDELKSSVNFGKFDIVRGPNDKLMGATLASLVEILTPHDTLIDFNILETFMMTFRLFTTPVMFAYELRSRFERADDVDDKFVSEPIRLRVFNLAKLWLESHWSHQQDSIALDTIELLAVIANTMDAFAASASIILNLVDKRRAEGDRAPVVVQSSSYSAISNQTRFKKQQSQNALKFFTRPLTPLSESTSQSSLRYSGSSIDATPPPVPQISKSLLNHLRSTSGLTAAPLPSDFEPIEMARQLTIVESRLYQCVTVEELLSVNEGGSSKKSTGINSRPGLKTMSEFTSRVTAWVSQSILREDEARRRVTPIKFWIKVCKHSLSLNNYGLLVAIVCGLTTSTISRLKRTWDVS